MSDYIPNLFSAARRAASNVYSAVVPEPIQRRITNFNNWLVNNVDSTDIPQVLDDFRLHVRRSIAPPTPDVRTPTQSRIRLRIRPSAQVPLVPQPPPIRERFDIRLERSAFRGYSRVYKIDGRSGYLPDDFYYETEELLQDTLRRNLQRKVKLVLRCRYYHINDPNKEEKEFAFHSNHHLNLNGEEVNDILQDMIDEITVKMDEFERRDSGWVFTGITVLELHTVAYEPLGANGWLDLPDWIKNKKAVINMKNNDNKCFLWCVLRHLYPKDKNADRIDGNLRSRECILNMKGIEYPVSFKDIDKFEKQNPEISVNVFGYENKNFYPLRNVGNENSNHVDLLYIKDEEKTHYALIKNFNWLIRSEVTKDCNGNIKFCKRCLNHFGNEELLKKHEQYCKDHENIRLEMPEKGTMLSFKNHYRKLSVPFVVYADFESILEPIHTCELNPEHSFTIQQHHHVPCSFYYLIKCFDENVCQHITKSYVGKDAREKFIEWVISDVQKIHRKNNKNKKPINMTKEEEADYENQTQCWFCGEEFKNDKVRDHCHFTGKYRGAAHNSCNL